MDVKRAENQAHQMEMRLLLTIFYIAHVKFLQELLGGKKTKDTVRVSFTVGGNL